MRQPTTSRRAAASAVIHVHFSLLVFAAAAGAVAANQQRPQCPAPIPQMQYKKYIPLSPAPGNYQFALEQDFESALKRAIEQEVRERERREEHERRQEERRKQQEEQRKQQEEARRKQQEEQQRRKQYEQQQNNKKKGFCPYRILGVAMDAEPNEIKKVYRKKALEMHPDKVKDCDEACHEKFTHLVDAYEILSDEDRRAMHDNESFGAYQSRPHSYDSKAGFYGGTSLVKPLNQVSIDHEYAPIHLRLYVCHHSQARSSLFLISCWFIHM